MTLDSLPGSETETAAITVVLAKTASAVHLETRLNGVDKLGLICQLPPGSAVELCGEGYSERTVKVRFKDHFYVIFRRDLNV